MGDVVIAAYQIPVLNRNDLLNILERKEAGDVVVLTILREEAELDVQLPVDIGP